jgi:hypothetical protein
MGDETAHQTLYKILLPSKPEEPGISKSAAVRHALLLIPGNGIVDQEAGLAAF